MPDAHWLWQTHTCIGRQASLMAQGHIWIAPEVVVDLAEAYLGRG